MSLSPGDIVTFPTVFKTKRTLGRGTFGVVYEVEHGVDKQSYALKCINYAANEPEEAMNELKLMTKLHHRNVVRYYSSFIVNTSTVPSNGTAELDGVKQLVAQTSSLTLDYSEFEDESDDSSAFAQARKQDRSAYKQPAERKDDSQSLQQVLYIQMQLCAQTLDDWLQQNKHPRARHTVLNIFNDVVEGLAYIHGQNVRHSDLRAANILFSLPPDDHAVISDFGISSYLGNRAGSSPTTTGVKGKMHSGSDTDDCSFKSENSSDRALKLEVERKIDINDLGKIFLQLVCPYEKSQQLTNAVFKARKERKLPAEAQVDDKDRDLLFDMFDADTALNACDILKLEPLSSFRASSSPSFQHYTLETADIVIKAKPVIEACNDASTSRIFDFPSMGN